jgi:endonuclease YncB( thermonuclease family)
MKKLLLYLLLCSPLMAETITGTCKRVVDGDTLHLDDGTKVQIWGIDAPEKGQPYAEKATAYLDKTIKGRKLKLKVRQTDQHGRKIAEVAAGDTDLALFMVRTGMAWHDDYNAPDATDLTEAMKKAKKAKKGLWADKAPVKPYLFRKGE